MVKNGFSLFERIMLDNEIENEDQVPYSGEKWKHYQDVKPLNIKVKPTKEDKKKITEFRKMIDKKNKNNS